MAIIVYPFDPKNPNDEGEICRDTNVSDEANVYFGNGQGCGTVWFKSVPDVRIAYKNNDDNEPDGHQAKLCEQCACHYSIADPQQKGKPFHACTDWKEHWTENLTKPPVTP